jgi:hypothetical protein
MNKQLEGYKQKDIIPKVVGKITKLWPAKEKEGKFGPYKIQGGDIEVDGETYGITFWDKEQNPDVLRDKVVVISCTKGKHGLGGIELGHESYSKSDGTKVDRDVLNVKKAAKVELEDGSTPEPAAERPASQPARVSQSVTLEDLIASHIAIDSQVREAYKDKEYDEETLRSYVASVFIEANKKGIQVAEAPKASSEDDWASFIVPSGSMKGKKLVEVGRPNLVKLYHHYWKAGFTTDFAKAVEKAGQVFNLPLPEEDNIPMDELPEIEWSAT